MKPLSDAQPQWMGLHRYILISLLLFIIIFPVSADEQGEYVIDKITFSISGKSKEVILRNTLNIKKGSSFTSYDKLQKAVDSDRQNFFNRRIFDKVESEITETKPGSHHYSVEFIIIDSFTLLAFPYPKYDSNYGAKLGVKLYDKNFLGLLSDLYFNAQVRQLAVDDFSNFHFESYLDVTDLQISEITLDFENSLIIDHSLGALENGQFDSSLKISNMSLGKTSFDISVAAELLQLEDNTTSELLWGDYDLDLGFTWKGLSFLTQKLDLSANANLDAVGHDITNSTITLYSSLSLPSFIVLTPDISLFAKDWYEFPYMDWENPLNHTIQAGITDVQTFLGMRHTVTYFAESEFLPEPFSAIDAGIEYSISGGKVNWHDNLRKGNSISLSFSASTPVSDGFSEALNNIKTVTSFTTKSFFKVGSLLSLGIKMRGFIATHEKDNFGYTPGEEVRGILNNNIPDQYGYKGLVVNTNLTMKVFDFTIYMFNRSPDGQLLFSPFLDMVFLDQTSSDLSEISPDVLRFSAGFESYIIFDSYRSYPICATLGFDLEDAIAAVNNEIDFGDIEFEVIFSLSMLY